MLRKRSSKAHLTSDPSDYSISSDFVPPMAKVFPFSSAPGLFMGLCSKGLSDSESARSPTSPLEFKVFSLLGNPSTNSHRSSGLREQNPRSWVCSKVGLGLVDSLKDETNPCGRVLGFTDSKNMLFGSQMIYIPIPKIHLDEPLGAAPKSLPKDYDISSAHCKCSQLKMAPGFSRVELRIDDFGKFRYFSAEIGTSSQPLFQSFFRKTDSKDTTTSDSENWQSESPPLKRGKDFGTLSSSLPVSINSSVHGFMGSLSASEIKRSEDYSCIMSHGPNSKTTQNFGDSIPGSHKIQPLDYKNKIKEAEEPTWLVSCSENLTIRPSEDFLSFCFFCKKKLEGKDIYIYRGEKAFCSCECRDQEILIEEEMEKPTSDSYDSLGSSSHEEIFVAGAMVAI